MAAVAFARLLDEAVGASGASCLEGDARTSKKAELLGLKMKINPALKE